MDKSFVCLACPVSCRLTVRGPENVRIPEDVRIPEEVRGTENGILVTGNRCPRGEEWGRNEFISPERLLTTTVKTVFSTMPLLPVRTSREVPLADIFLYMKEVNLITVRNPAVPGTVVAEHLLGKDVDLLAAGECP